MRLSSFAILSISALAVLTGCATGIAARQSDPALKTRYSAYEGPPISQFTWLGHFYSWEALGKDQLVVFTTPGDAYFLKVWPNCDLNFAMNGRGVEDIGVTSTSGTVSSGLDSVIENSSSVGHENCPISEIRKIDYGRMRADDKARAKAKNAQQPTGSTNQ